MKDKGDPKANSRFRGVSSRPGAAARSWGRLLRRGASAAPKPGTPTVRTPSRLPSRLPPRPQGTEVAEHYQWRWQEPGRVARERLLRSSVVTAPSENRKPASPTALWHFNFAWFQALLHAPSLAALSQTTSPLPRAPNHCPFPFGHPSALGPGNALFISQRGH